MCAYEFRSRDKEWSQKHDILYYKSQKLIIDKCLPGHHDHIQNCMNRFKIVSN